MVTGAGGWIGSRLLRWLVERNAGDVFALVRPGADRSRLREIERRLTIIEADLLDQASVERQLDIVRPDTCVHFAWYAVPGLYLESPENLRSLQASIALATRLAERNCHRFVGVGTCFEYAMQDHRLNESSPTEPKSLYAASKLAFRLLLEQIAKASRMEWLWARVFYQYGPEEDHRRLVPTVVRALLAGEPALLTSGEQARDFLHVDDVASAIGTAAASELDGVVNIGSGRPVRVADLATKVGAIIGRPDLIRLGARPTDPADPPFVCADATRLESTGWRPTYNLDTGLADTIEWFRRQPVPAKKA